MESLKEGRLNEALLDLWLQLKIRARLNDAEQQRADDRPAYARRHDEYLSALNRGGPALCNLPLDTPLALLQALDQHLYLRRSYKRAPAIGLRREAEGYFLHPRRLPRGHQPASSTKAGSIQAWLRYHWILPERINGITIQIREAKDANIQRLSNHPRLTLLIGRFPDEIRPAWQRDTAGWRALRLTDPEVRWHSMERLLNSATAYGAQILVLPELTLCPELRERTATWLRENRHPLLLVLPGSFHREEPTGIFNHAELLDATGEPLLDHRKLTAYGSINAPERIRVGERIELLDTPAGLFATPICLDFCDERLGSLWRELGIDWALVPSFGEGATVRAHHARAKALHRAHAAVTAVANQHPEGIAADSGFIHPGEEPTADDGTETRETTIDL